MYKAKDVDSYLSSAAREALPKLKEIREIIKSTLQTVEEGISCWCAVLQVSLASCWIFRIQEPRQL